MGSRRIPSVDGLRAISIGFVLFGHLAGTSNFFPRSTFAPLGDFGNLGVRVFFVISGFLITFLMLDEIEATGTVSLKLFYLRRTLRIFPPPTHTFCLSFSLPDLDGRRCCRETCSMPSLIRRTTIYILRGWLGICGLCRSRSSFTCFGRP